VVTAEQFLVEVDEDACCASGRCAATEPRVFDQSEQDGTVILRTPTVAAELRDAVLLCQSLCPCGAISVSPAPAAEDPPAELVADDSRLGEQVRWLLELLDRPAGAGLSAEDSAHFVPAFLDKQPTGLAPLIEGWRARGPYVVESYRPVAHKAWVGVRDAAGERSELTFTLDSTGLIRIVAKLPAATLPVVRSWPDLDRVLDLPGVRFSVLAAEVVDGGLRILHARNAERPMPAGSMFKFYIMHAVARAIRAGSLCWDDELTLTSRLRSLPTGDLQDRPDGSRIRIRDATHKMMAFSDNTAADLLLHALGRSAVEQAVLDLGHRDPALLRPFPSSRELFQLGWGDPALRAAWAGAAEAERRALLARVAGAELTVRTQDMADPVHQLGLDWFVSAQDVASALIGLCHDAELDETGVIRTALTTNRGIPLDTGSWPAVVFKGGSNPGVLAFCWLVEGVDGRRFVLVEQQLSPDPLLVRDTRPLLAAAEQVIGSLLGDRDRDGNGDGNGGGTGR
jgi:beta-lactamase class A/ferredoxin